MSPRKNMNLCQSSLQPSDHEILKSPKISWKLTRELRNESLSSASNMSCLVSCNVSPLVTVWHSRLMQCSNSKRYIIQTTTATETKCRWLYESWWELPLKIVLPRINDEGNPGILIRGSSVSDSAIFTNSSNQILTATIVVQWALR